MNGGLAMSIRGLKAVLLTCGGVGALLAATADANAGGLAVREQSAWGEGTSYAGVAAGGDLSSMFWNPATMTQMPGINSETSVSGIIPSSTNSVGAPSTLTGAGITAGTGNTALSALVPSSYYSWQVNQQLWLGLSVNAPFGLEVQLPDTWAGRDYGAGGSNMSSYNFTPSVAYKINNWISVGAGVQIQYATATFTQGIGAAPTSQVSVNGAGYGYGFTAGVTLTPTPTTTVGLGWRSAINQKINGTMSLPATIGGFPATPAFGSTPGSVNTTIDLPDIVSLGLRQKLTSQWTAMATVEWTNWSRIGTVNILQPNGAPATVGANNVTIPFQWKDGWFYSLGAEYQWNPQLALRAGVAYEQSPITDQVRVPVLPDNNRTWLSVGASYQLTPKIGLDFAYSHIFVNSTPISVVPGNPFYNGAVSYTGTVDSHIDIISVAMKYRWDDPAEPTKSTLYHK